MRRLLAPALLLSIAAAAAADSVAFDEFGVAFGDDGATYAIVHRVDGSERVRVYSTPDGALLTPKHRERITASHVRWAGHPPVGEVSFDGYGGTLLLAARGSVVVRVRESIESNVADERAAVVQLQSTEGGVSADVMLSQLLDESVRKQLPRSISSVNWFDRAWIDAASEQCVILAGGDRRWAIAPPDGALGPVTTEHLEAGVRRRSASDALHALVALACRGDATRDRLLRLAHDDDLDARARTHVVAEFVGRYDAAADAAEIVLPSPLGGALLRGLARSSRQTPHFPHTREQRLGAIRLIGLLERNDRDIAALLAVAADEDDALAAAAVAALTRSECSEHRRELRALIADQPRHAGALGAYYAEHRDAKAVPPLVDALAAC